MTFKSGRLDPRRLAGLLMLATLAIPAPLFAQAQVDSLKSFVDGTAGTNPAGPMMLAPDGWIYGLTVGIAAGDPSNCAGAFRFNPLDPAGTFRIASIRQAPDFTSGCVVGDGGLVLAGDGNMYFTTLDGGPCNSGRVFRLSTPGTVAPFFDFPCGPPTNFNNPANGLSIGPDGALYGVVPQGGTNGRGGVYRLSLSGAFSAVVNFTASHTGRPDPLTTGSDGVLYGTESNVSTPSFVYRVDPRSGSAQRLFEWSAVSALDGAGPRGRLLEVAAQPGEDIAFVGVTQSGGIGGAGVVYRVGVSGTTGTLSKLHDFVVDNVNPYAGETPAAGLIRGMDGAVYGTTAGYAGFLGPVIAGPGIPASGELGTIYRIRQDGAFEKLFGGLIQPFAPLALGSDGSFYGTSYVGAATCSPTLCDAVFGSIFRLTLPAPPNSAPVAVDGSLRTLEDTPAGGALAASDADGDALIYSILTGPAKGAVTITNPSTGTYTYTPAANLNGADSFTFKVNDGSAESNVATVTVAIQAVNDAPVAVDGTALVTAGASTSGTLVASDVDSAILTRSIGLNGTKGVATITNPQTGAFTYTANAGASGTDSFTFKANDGELDSNVATETVVIAPAGCASVSEVTADVRISVHRPEIDRVTRHFTQRIRVENRSGAAIAGPVSYVLDALTAGTTVVGASGFTTCTPPIGSPFLTLDVGRDNLLNDRERVEFVLDLINGSAATVAHTSRVLAGSGIR